MTKVLPNTSLIVRYLLGRLPDDEQAGFEEQLLESEALFEALKEVESELIDEYVGDTLSADDRRQFELYFLIQPERRARVEFARALREAAAEHSRAKRSRAAVPEIAASPDTTAWWRRWGEFLIPRPQFAALAACCLIATFTVLGGLILALRDNSQLRQQLQQAQAERAESQERSAARLAAAESQLSSERSLRQRAEEALDSLNVRTKKGGPAIASFILSAFFRPVRGGESRPMPKSQQFLIPAAAKRVSLTFDVKVQSSDFSSYRVSLRRANDLSQNEIWGRSGLPAVSQPGQRIPIVLPAGLLIEGEYRLKLSGELSGSITEAIGEYRFEVVRD